MFVLGVAGLVVAYAEVLSIGVEDVGFVAVGFHPAVEDLLGGFLACGDILGDPAVRSVASINDALAHGATAGRGVGEEVLGGHLLGVILSGFVEVIV